MAGAATGDCFANEGTEQDPDLQPDDPCAAGDFKVVWVLYGTTATSGCDAVTGDDWNVPDDIDDQVLCLSYQDSSDAYNAAVGDCVFAAPGYGQTWSTLPCGFGNFAVVSRHPDTTAKESVCGSGTEWYTSFRVTGRIFQNDDPSFCGSDGWVTWAPSGYSSLGVTTCVLPMN